MNIESDLQMMKFLDDLKKSFLKGQPEAILHGGFLNNFQRYIDTSLLSVKKCLGHDEIYHMTIISMPKTDNWKNEYAVNIYFHSKKIKAMGPIMEIKWRPFYVS